MRVARVKFSVLVVVCHPDDEALWIGGTLHALSQFPEIRVSVICLSGADVGSPRQDEFHRAKACAGYHSGAVLGGKLRSAHEPLPVIAGTLEQGLKQLDIDVRDVSLLITHSPYGDEHMHPHHRQASKELYSWADRNNVSFAYFSCIPIPSFRLRPLLTNLKRNGAFHVLNVSRCEESVWRLAGRLLRLGSKRTPNYFVQLLTDMTTKKSMLGCYRSIDLESHSEGYAMFTNNCESIYVFEKKGFEVIQYVMDKMSIPGCPNLFAGILDRPITMRRIINKLIPRKS